MGSLFCWGDHYSRALPEERQQLLELASRQGAVYHDQAGLGSAHELAEVLASLLAGEPVPLEPLRISPDQELSLSELDPTQRAAATRALHAPDLFLVQGLPGSGKSRMVAHLICQATARRERVLLTAPSTAAIDRVLEQLPQKDHLCPLRQLDPDEQLEDLPPRIRRMVLLERVRIFEQETLPQARQAVEAAEQLLAQRQADRTIWGRIRELTDQAKHLASQLGQARTRKEALPQQLSQWRGQEVQLPPGPLAEQVAACRQRHAQALARLTDQLEELKRQQGENEAQARSLAETQSQLQALTDVRGTFRVWSPLWWRARLEKDLPGQQLATTRQIEELGQARSQIQQQVKELTQEHHLAQVRLEEECARLCEEEAHRQEQQLNDEVAGLESEQDRVRDKWSQLCGQLSTGVEAPAALADGSLAQAHSTWEDVVLRDEQRLSAARKWLAHLEEASPTYASEVQRLANVRAATLASLLSIPSEDPAPLHDLLVVEEAEELTEEDLLHLARQARRAVLVGRSPLTPSSSLQTPSHQADAFHRLWSQLHPAPSALPYRWSSTEQGLTCTLREIEPPQERWVQRECLADRPEIELIFLVPPGESPLLAKVYFPGETPIAQAKETLFRELGELPIQGSLPELRWEESDREIRVHLSASSGSEAVSLVELEAGVREEVVSRPAPHQGGGEAGWLTRALTFERAAGWSRDGAETWLAEHSPFPLTGRTALLRVPHRMEPSLACWVSDFLFGGAYAGPLPEQPHQPSPVSFLAVPPLDHERKDRGRGASRWKGGDREPAPRLGSLKGGAGLELDLARRGRVDQQLPVELRNQLPEQGLINYVEAQAIIAYLEELVRTPSFCQAARRWQMEHPLCLEGKGIYDGLRQPNLAVIALYPAQVALLQLLLEQSPARACGPVIEVGLPGAFRQRDCQQVVLGLTRSHASRAVAYEPSPGLLAQALCLACERLVLAGDPGTLLRRSGWTGAVDHQGPALARLERDLLLRLVAYLEGQGEHPAMFQLQESCRV